MSSEIHGSKKRCTAEEYSCGKIKPLSEFYTRTRYYKHTSKTSHYGRCKECQRAFDKRRPKQRRSKDLNKSEALLRDYATYPAQHKFLYEVERDRQPT